MKNQKNYISGLLYMLITAFLLMGTSSCYVERAPVQKTTVKEVTSATSTWRTSRANQKSARTPWKTALMYRRDSSRLLQFDRNLNSKGGYLSAFTYLFTECCFLPPKAATKCYTPLSDTKEFIPISHLYNHTSEMHFYSRSMVNNAYIHT